MCVSAHSFKKLKSTLKSGNICPDGMFAQTKSKLSKHIFYNLKSVYKRQAYAKKN